MRRRRKSVATLPTGRFGASAEFAVGAYRRSSSAEVSSARASTGSRRNARTGDTGCPLLSARRDDSSARCLPFWPASNGHTSTPLGPLRRPPVPEQLNRGRRKKRRERNGKQRPRRPNKRAGQRSKRGATEMASARVGVLSVRVHCDAADRAFMLIARTTLDAATREAFRTASIWMPIRVERAVRRRP